MVKPALSPIMAEVQAPLSAERKEGRKLRETTLRVAPSPAPKDASSRVAAELLADLGEARRAERQAASRLREVRAQLATTIVLARAAGLPYDRLAQHSLRAVRGPTVSLDERHREAVRLRKLAHRHRVTTGHGSRLAEPGVLTSGDPPSMQTGGTNMSQRLISRKTIEEHFVDDDEDDRIEDADDMEEEDGGEDDKEAPEPPRAARPRR